MYIKPCFFDSFRCKADKCTDTCCAGWEVDIDDVTLEKYNALNGSIKERFSRAIIYNDGQACFKLDKNERCCFLNKNGLCDIYSALGEDFLCDICREHPRFYDEFDSILQCGLGLCCEKVCEMIIEAEKLSFIKDFSYDDISEDIRVLLEVRDCCFSIICDKTKTFETRIRELVEFAMKSERELFGEVSSGLPFFNKKDAVAYVLSLYGKTEPINALWTGFLYSLNNNFGGICSCEYEPDFCLYEKLLSYIIYRHFMNCRFDGRICDVICFSICAITFINLCECYSFITNGKVSDADKTDIIKRWSQQIEYSQENTDMCLTFG